MAAARELRACGSVTIRRCPARAPQQASLAPITVLALAAVAAVAAIGVIGARSAHAQCEANASSCVDCHEIQRQRPVLDDARPWHRDHRFGDLCVACHGGDGSATSQLAAHAGRRDPLADSTASCGGCHTDHVARVDRYLAFAGPAAPQGDGDGDEPSSSSSSSSSIENASSEPAAPVASAAPTSSPAPARAPSHRADRVLTLAALVLTAVLAWQLTRRRPRTSAVAWLRAPRWSPYVAGAGLGVVVAISEGVLRRPLSASGAFDKLAAYPGHALFPRSVYWAHVMTPAITWQVWLMLGLLLGAFASSTLSHQAHATWLPDAQWVPRFGVSRARRLAIAFVGAALVQIGAGIAGGCTSGLAISGGALLAPAAFVFMAGMFAGGVPTACWWYRGRS